VISEVTADYSDEQLRAAWLACKGLSWPATFEEAMADPVRSNLVRLHAWRIAHPRTPAPRPAAAPPEAAPPQLNSSFSPPPGYVDLKRAASGDRDD
jgi:hypothetical protein